MDSGDISERMYEAAFLPEKWVPLLDDLAIDTNSGAGKIRIVWPVQRGIKTTFDISPGREPWEQSTEQTKTWLSHVRSGPYINRGFFQIDPLNGDWSNLSDFEQRIKNHKSRGYGVQAAAIVELFNGEVISLALTRRTEEPRFEADIMGKLNSIYSDFRQSVLFASRLQFERARGGIQTLNNMGLPAVLLNSDGQILLSNELFGGVDEYFSNSSSGRLSIKGSDGLRKYFAHALEISETKSTSVPIPADEYRNAAVAQLMPMRRDAKSIFSMFCKIMVVAPVSTSVGVPSPELVSKLFGLTPAEANLATTLVSGLSLRDSAANRGITVGTARSYLVRIFSKTGTGQQSELVSLLKNLAFRAT